MTDLAKVGFSADTAPLQSLNQQLDSTKQSVKGLNDELQKTPAASTSAASSLGQVSTAAQGVKNAGAETALQNVSSGLAKTAEAAATMATGMGKTAEATKTVASSLDQNLSPSVQRATGFFGNFKQAFTEGFTNAINQANAPIAQAGQVTKTLEDYVKSSGLSYEQAAAAMQKSTVAQTALNTATKESGGFFNTIKNAVTGFGQSLVGTTTAVSQHAAKTREMASEHEHASSAAMEVRETIHTLDPVLGAAGLQMSSLTQFTGAARAGLLALGVSIAGTVLVELQKMADESKTAQTRLEGLAGVKVGDRIAEQLEKAVNSAGHLPTAIAPAIESMVKLQQMQFDPHVITAVSNGFESTGVSARRALDSVQSLFESMRIGGTTADAATTDTNKFFTDLQKEGKLTSQTFQQLQTSSPATAQAIANIFFQGRVSATQFVEMLKQQPATVESVVRALEQMKSANDSAYQSMINNPATVGDALVKLKNKFVELTDAAQDSLKEGERQPGIVTRAINLLADGLDELNTKGLPDAKRNFDLTANSTKQWGDMVKIVADENSIWGKSIEIDIVGATEKALIDIGNFATNAPQAMTNFVNTSISTLSGWGNSFVSAIESGLNAAMTAISNFVANALSALQKVGNAVANTASGISSGGGTGSYDAMGSSTGVGDGNVSSGTDFASAVGDGTYPAFATGGSFTVGGSGGTDSQLIQFMATPGEQVTIDQPGGSAADQGKPTLGSLMPVSDGAKTGPQVSSDLAAAQFAEALKTQTQALKDSELIDRTAIVAAVSNSTAQIVASIKSIAPPSSPAAAANGGTSSSSSGSSGNSSSSSGGGGGGGGGGSSTMSSDPRYWSKEEEQQAKADEAAAAKQQPATLDPFASSFGADAVRGIARAIQGGVGGLQTAPIDYGKTSGQGSMNAQGLTPGSQMAGAQVDPAQYGPLNAMNASGRGDTQSVTNYGGRGGPVTQQVQVEKPSADVKEQTQTLKQSQDAGSKTVADQVRSQTLETKSIGDKTTSSLGNVESSALDQAKSMASVSSETADNTDINKAGNDISQSGFQDANTTLNDVKSVGSETNASVGETTNAVSSGSGNIVDAVRGLGSTIGDAISSAISNIANMASSNTASSSATDGNAGSGISGSSSGSGSGSSSGGDFTGGGDTSGSSAAVADGAPPAVGFATGGQFAVSGKGHADTELIQFYASPGETVTITPPGGTPPPNPSMDSHVSKGPKPSYATGGQMTVGGMLGTPTVSTASADLIAAHVAASMANQNAAISSKLDGMTSTLVVASNNATSSILDAVNRISSSFATGGQFRVGGIRGFATGGQMAVGDGTGFANDNVSESSVDSVSSGLDHREQLQTGTLGDKINASTNMIAQSIANNGAKVSSGITKLGTSVAAALSAARASHATPATPTTTAAPNQQQSSSMWGDPVGSPLWNYRHLSANMLMFNNNPGAKQIGFQDIINNGGWSPQISLPGFATGGQFMVGPGKGMADGGAFTVPGGTSGADSVDVAIKAAPGEKIFVVPPEEAARMKASHAMVTATPEPISDYLPRAAAAAIPGNSAAVATGGAVTGWKGSMSYQDPVAARAQAGAGGAPITIVVQDKVQADDFIRARAQIQRSMRG